jgi:hypothetical protein
MLSRIYIVFIAVIVTDCQALLNIPFSNLIRRSNLTCASNSIFYNRTGCELCIIKFFNISSSTDGRSFIRHDCVQKSNSLRRVSQRCTGFSNMIYIGYGVCSPLAYETFDVYTLCICATDFCNTNLTSCRQSVTEQLSSNTSPLLLSLIYYDLTKNINDSQTIIVDDDHRFLFDRCISCALWLIVTLFLTF